MLSVYTFVFAGVFKARWSSPTESTADFALALFVGLCVFNLFAECLSRAPTLVVTNVNYVKRVVFPLEVLPIVSLGTALFNLAVSFIAWLIGYLILNGIPPVTALAYPVTLLPLMLFTLGVSWFAAALGVYVRDLTHIIGIVTSVLLFMTPIFYPTAALPERIRPLLAWNPLAIIIEQARGLLLWGTVPSAAIYCALTGAGAVTCWLGFWWFQRTRRGFADVI
jgi:lipopolysaccharide transport system permease protein